MILDSWKRLYSNSPASNFRGTCIAGLWKGGDIPNSPNKEVSIFDPRFTQEREAQLSKVGRE